MSAMPLKRVSSTRPLGDVARMLLMRSREANAIAAEDPVYLRKSRRALMSGSGKWEMGETGSKRRSPITTSRFHDFTTSRLHDFTTSRPHDLTTSRPHDLTTSRPHDLTTSRPRDLQRRRHAGHVELFNANRRHESRPES